jgi:mono/diheme cytochrome c family protein
MSRTKLSSQQSNILSKAILLALLLGATFFAGCAFREEKIGSESDGIALLPANEQGVLSYEYVKREVLSQCINCHGTQGGVTIENYSQTVSRLVDIERTTLKLRTMPKGSTLSDRQLSILKTWIFIGAPELGAVPPPPPPTLLANYESIEKLVLNTRCTGCHDPGGEAGWIPLKPSGNLVAHVNLANPENSILMKAIRRLGEGNVPKMPPSNANALSAEEVATILEWIRLGAPETAN